MVRRGGTTPSTLVRGTGRSRWPHKYFATWLWTRLVTKFALRLLLPYEMIQISKPLKPPIESLGEDGKPVRAPALFPRLVSEINEPRVQALISRFDLDDPDDHKLGAKNWMHYVQSVPLRRSQVRFCSSRIDSTLRTKTCSRSARPWDWSALTRFVMARSSAAHVTA